MVEITLPREWRTNTVLGFKKGNRQNAANYKPSSLMSKSCKRLESIIKKQKDIYLHRKNSERQHSFKEYRSWITNLINF